MIINSPTNRRIAERVEYYCAVCLHSCINDSDETQFYCPGIFHYYTSNIITHNGRYECIRFFSYIARVYKYILVGGSNLIQAL